MNVLSWLPLVLFVPGLFALVLLMNWLEVYFTYRQVADDVAIAWQSTESADDLEAKVGRLVAQVISAPR